MPGTSRNDKRRRISAVTRREALKTAAAGAFAMFASRLGYAQGQGAMQWLI